MYFVFLDALIDTVKIIPLLFIIYIGIEYLEYKLDDGLVEKVKRAGKVAPSAGALFGLVPQCGFSVMATALYCKRILTIGTLLAVYISTSDEALPIILSQPDKLGVLLPLLLSKLIIAVIAGYAIDFIFTRKSKNTAESELCASTEGVFDIPIENKDIIEEKGCCGHSCSSEKSKINTKELILHPLEHTLKVFAYLFIASFIINLVIFKVGEENLAKAFMSHSILQPIAASIFGLIPNCASSVAITEIFLKGGLTFGSAVAGLSSGAGLGLLVLFRENKDLKNSLKVVGLLTVISSISGIVIQLLFG